MIYPQYPPHTQIDPWAQLWICRLHQRTAHRDDPLIASELRDRLSQLRQEFIGTGLGLTMLVHDFRNHSPNMKAVEDLSNYLGKRIDYFLRSLWPGSNRDTDQTDLATSVMYFGLLLYAYDTVGQDKVDDLIRWAECYAQDPELMALVVDGSEGGFPMELKQECWEFVAENEQPPSGFLDATIAAVAVFTGAICDPLGETI
jgi:hypothetical protein